MVGMAGFPMTENSIRSQIASAIKIVVQMHQFADGKRRVTSVSEITGLDGSVVLVQEIFRLLRAKPASRAGNCGLRACGRLFSRRSNSMAWRVQRMSFIREQRREW